MVTLNGLYREGRAIIEKAGLLSPAFDAMCLLEPVFGIRNRTELAVRGMYEVRDEDAERYLDLCRERLSRPLQYILGRWEFCGMELKCGEGVLVPREDTLALVECAAEALKDIENPVILDLCAGTGAVGLGVYRTLGKGKCTCVELYDEAYSYLISNIETFGEGMVSAERADVLCPPDSRFETVDAILSNPPYIETSVMKTLEGDVLKEPETALDGGEDGLVFYKAILRHWLPLLKTGGILAVETGFDQMESVSELFHEAKMAQIRAIQDINGNHRAIIGTKACP